MSIMTVNGFVGALVLASVGLGLSACNTTKATVDTFAKFTSSTSPGEFINGDGVVRESQKARLFTAVVFENLEQGHRPWGWRISHFFGRVAENSRGGTG